MEDNRLDGRVAVITGGAHGIGKSYALGFAACGATVAVLDLDGSGAEKVASEISTRGGHALSATVDISNPERVDAAIAKVIDAFGKIDVLINNAAMFSVVPMSRAAFDELSIAEWDKMMEVNLKGTWLMCRAVAPSMKSNGYGKIINVSSGSVFTGTTAQIHYVTSKAAILGFTRTLARELGPHGVRVNTLAPGGTLSEDNPTPDAIAMREKGAANRILGRIQMPEDLVGTAIFLASGESDFITGQAIVVDGGVALH